MADKEPGWDGSDPYNNFLAQMAANSENGEGAEANPSTYSPADYRAFLANLIARGLNQEDPTQPARPGEMHLDDEDVANTEG